MSAQILYYTCQQASAYFDGVSCFTSPKLRQTARFIFGERKNGSGDWFDHNHALHVKRTQSAYQADSAEEVVVKAHQVDLAHCSQCLLLGKLAGARVEPHALGSHANCTAADNDHPAAKQTKPQSQASP